MAKHNGSNREKSRFRVVVVEGEVLPGELQVFAQAVAAAIRPISPPLTSARLVPAVLPTAKTHTEQPNLFDEAEDALDAKEQLAPEPPVAKLQNGAAKKKLRTPQAISGLDFTAGEKPLNEYIREVAPKQQSKRYLAIIFWLRTYRNLAEVSADHIYTAYRFLGMNVPDDVGAPLRSLKKQAWLEKGSNDGFYKITHIGENQLTKESE